VDKLSISEIKKKIEDNKGILLILLSKDSCPVCGNFKDIVDEIKSEHSEYLSTVVFDADDIEGLGVVPHPTYPMSYFYINNEQLPFIRAGLVYGELLNIEILKFKQVLDGEDPNVVFGG
jgi:glutaredoxin-related protein